MTSNVDASLAVLIATCNRTGLLAQRSLTAVQNQTRKPNYLVVVDDSDEKFRGDNRNVVNDVKLQGVRVIYLRNTRHKGACGAWNEGLQWLMRKTDDPRRVFVAILDDDDEWMPEHLDVCMRTACDGGFDMVAPAIERITTNDRHIQRPPSKLEASLFLVGNPHIQGSNLFVRLSALLEAGTFDESLTSSTDRDLCIRLADLGWVRYSPIEQITVRHYAEDDRLRMSSPRSDRKLQGLDRFWAKWRGRMTDEQKRVCLKRAKEYFDWSPSDSEPTDRLLAGPLVPSVTLKSAEQSHKDDLVLVVGVIADTEHTKQFSRLLEQLLGLQSFEQICGLDVVILENGASNSSLDDLVADYRSRGLTLFHASKRQQIEDAQTGVFGEGFTRPDGRAPIGPARTMLQSYVTRVANQREGAIAWILDDDSSLDNLGDGTHAPPFHTLLASLKRAKDEYRVDVLLGTVTGDPPVPPGTSVRTQLVDFYHNLAWLLQLDPKSELPDRSSENRIARAAAKDFYYDLSRRDTHHLEWPFWITPASSGETVEDALSRMIASLPRVLAGQTPFRPLVIEHANDIIASMRPSAQRGTNTFVFDMAAFQDFPNPALEFDGSTLRRSDMIWALLNRYAGGRRIVQASLPVRHDRSDEPICGIDWKRLVPDIRGYAVYSALDDVLIQRRERRLRDGLGAEHPDVLDFKGDDIKFGTRRFRKYLEERTAALLLSCWRIQGLCQAIETMISTRFAAQCVANAARHLQVVSKFLEQTRSDFALDRIHKVAPKVKKVDVEKVESFFRDFSKIVEKHKKAVLPPTKKDEWFHRERRASAIAIAKKAVGTDNLRLLGSGGEGVVFASAEKVVKVIDYSKRSPANGAWDGILKLASSNQAATSLYRLSLPKIAPGRTIICYDFEPSTRYLGGKAGDILQILRDCRSLGIVTTNFHPKNLRVTDNGVRLIDYGSDIRPYTAEGFKAMVQRAWLTLRYHDRRDLSELMRNALKNEHLPELEGWESLLAAVDPPSKREVIDDAVLDLVRGWKPHKVLDFGCGHGRVAVALAREGVEVAAYDPDANLRPWWQQEPSVCWLTGDVKTALVNSKAQFDAVICSLVLCDIESDADYHAAIHRIAEALCESGRFLIIECNPEETFAGDSTLQRRFVPRDAKPAEIFSWTKELSNGKRRKDTHRPLSRLVSDLRSEGLGINSVTTTGGISLETLAPSSDYLILCGIKGRVPSVPSKSLLQCVRGVTQRTPKSVPILCYHRVLPEGQDDAVSPFQRQRGTVVDLAVFKHQLDELQRHFQPIQMDQYLAWLDGETDVPLNACLLTFDDAYRDFSDFVLPELDTRKMPCTLFATISAVRGEALLPVDILYSALGAAQRHSKLNQRELADWVTGKKKKRYIHAKPEERRRMLESAKFPLVDLPPASLYLTEKELAGLPQHLVTLGGHGVHHELLSEKTFSELRAELRRVRFWLEQINNRPDAKRLTLAFPNGSCDSTCIAAVIEAGFVAAFTVEPWREGSTNHRWRLCRSCIPNRADAITCLVAGKQGHL